MNSGIKDHINRINTKLQQLLKEYRHLQKENEGLNKSIAEMSAKQKQQAATIEMLEQQVAVLKASAGSMSEADKKEFEKRINGYLKQVDKTINLLSE